MSELGKRKIRLGVNIDHVATIRNARGTEYPSPIIAAKMAVDAGADGITAHLREDRRHIRDSDIRILKDSLSVPLNLEIAATEEMAAMVIETKPNSACLVPERRQELTTEGGLDVSKGFNYLKNFIRPIKKCGAKVSLFVEADELQIRAASDLGADIVEFHVGKYCELLEVEKIDLAQIEFERYVNMAKFAGDLGLEVHLGHGLTYRSAKNLSKVKEVREMNIGHFLIGEAIYYGMNKVIKKMKTAINN